MFSRPRANSRERGLFFEVDLPIDPQIGRSKRKAHSSFFPFSCSLVQQEYLQANALTFSQSVNSKEEVVSGRTFEMLMINRIAHLSNRL